MLAPGRHLSGTSRCLHAPRLRAALPVTVPVCQPRTARTVRLLYDHIVLNTNLCEEYHATGRVNSVEKTYASPADLK